MIFREYLDRLVDASPIDMYVSGIDGARVYWPWRMNKAKASETRQAFVDACDHHIMDSNFQDESVTNADVFDEAERMGSDGAVLADVYQDAEATIDALLDGLDTYDDHSYDGLIILPLQDPHVDVYEAVEPAVGDRNVWWAVGGFKDRPPVDKIEAAKRLRDVVGPNEHIHGLGWGATKEVTRAVRRNPRLLDSIDNSTGTQNADISDVSEGKERSSVTAMRAQAHRVEALREFTHFVGGTPAERRPANQHGLDTVLAATDGGKQ